MTIQSVKRALDILSLFSAAQPQLGITDISKLMVLPKTTVHGLVQTLCEQGFLGQDSETRKYSLGLKIHVLGTYLSSTMKINQVGAELTRRLAERSNKLARLGIWNKNSVLITHNVLILGSELMYGQQLGPWVPAYCTGMGKAILSTFTDEDIAEYLEKTPLKPFTSKTVTDKTAFLKSLEVIKNQGFAEDQEEHVEGMSCISAPIFDRTRKAIGAISLSTDPWGFLEKDLHKTVTELKQVAMEISRRMGYFPEVSPSE